MSKNRIFQEELKLLREKEGQESSSFEKQNGEY